MNTLTSYVVIAILAAVLTTSVSAVYGQGYTEEACPDCPGGTGATQNRGVTQKDIPIRLWTDKAEYDHKSKIVVEGQVANVKPNTQIGLVVIGPPPFNNIVAIDQLTVGSDGKYKTTLSTAGESWKYDGTYTIKVTYGSQNINNKALVTLTGAGTTPGGAQCATGQFAAGQQCVPYTITGATITSAKFNSQAKSLTINISSFNDGTLMVNPSMDHIKGIFMVLVDGEEWDEVEIDGNKVTVMFPAGTDKIEIIGTFAIPEFGAIAALILAVAIISIIVVSTRTRLNVLPKY